MCGGSYVLAGAAGMHRRPGHKSNAIQNSDKKLNWHKLAKISDFVTSGKRVHRRTLLVGLCFE